MKLQYFTLFSIAASQLSGNQQLPEQPNSPQSAAMDFIESEVLQPAESVEPNENSNDSEKPAPCCTALSKFRQPCQNLTTRFSFFPPSRYLCEKAGCCYDQKTYTNRCFSTTAIEVDGIENYNVACQNGNKMEKQRMSLLDAGLFSYKTYADRVFKYQMEEKPTVQEVRKQPIKNLYSSFRPRGGYHPTAFPILWNWNKDE